MIFDYYKKPSYARGTYRQTQHNRMEPKNRLLSKIELFYDASPFQEKKSEIFDNSN